MDKSVSYPSYDGSFGEGRFRNSPILTGSCRSGWLRIYFLIIMDYFKNVLLLISYCDTSVSNYIKFLLWIICSKYFIPLLFHREVPTKLLKTKFKHLHV